MKWILIKYLLYFSTMLIVSLITAWYIGKPTVNIVEATITFNRPIAFCGALLVMLGGMLLLISKEFDI